MEQEDKRQAVFEAWRHIKAAERLLRLAAEAEPNHGYATIGGAYDKLWQRARYLASETQGMVKDPARGSQRVRGGSL